MIHSTSSIQRQTAKLERQAEQIGIHVSQMLRRIRPRHMTVVIKTLALVQVLNSRT